MRIPKLLFLFFLIALVIVSPVDAEEAGAPVSIQPQYYKDLKYPEMADFENEKTAGKINAIFRKYIESSYEELKETEEQAKQNEVKAEYQTDFEVKFNHYPRLSLVTKNYMFAGGAHGRTRVESFNFDLRKGKRIYLTDILKEENQLKEVEGYVWKYAIERPDIFYPDLKKEDVQLTKDTAFYFTEDGITLIFQQYEIAPYVSGNQEIDISEKIYKQQMLK